MGYSLRRFSEPRELCIDSICPNTNMLGQVRCLIIGVQSTCELMSIFAKHLNEFELDPNWIFSSAVECLCADDPIQAVQAWAQDIQTPCEWDELTTLQLIVEQAMSCIACAVPDNFSRKDYLRLSFGKYDKQKILLFQTVDYEYE